MKATSALRSMLRIVIDTATYRLEKREAGNLVTSMTLGLALRLPPRDLGIRFVFGALLNLWVYLANDLLDLAVDLRAPSRARGRVEFLAAHTRQGWILIGVLSALLLALGGMHSAGLTLCFVSTAIIIVVYTRVLKHRPIVDLLAMTAWGLSMSLVGFPLHSAAGLRFAGLLGILCTITEAIQVLRDADSDRASGVRTTAVVLGEQATVWIARGLVVVAAAYTSLVLSRWWGGVFLLALFVPLKAERAARSWDAFRVVFGVGWLVLLFAHVRAGRLEGWVP
jgi:4-hydroxybenzoate polyprenyltransferase